MGDNQRKQSFWSDRLTDYICKKIERAGRDNGLSRELILPAESRANSAQKPFFDAGFEVFCEDIFLLFIFRLI